MNTVHKKVYKCSCFKEIIILINYVDIHYFFNAKRACSPFLLTLKKEQVLISFELFLYVPMSHGYPDIYE